MTEDQTGMTADQQVQAMADRINSLVLEQAILRAAVKDLVRICDAVRYTAGLGSGQVERVNQARKLITAGEVPNGQ